jgi:hypothetical protein
MASKYIDIAVIVEPREHKCLKIVIENILNKLVDVNVILFHGNKNKDFILANLYNNIDKIKLINLKVDNLTVKQYSDILITKDFWEQIDGERILLFQTDSIICNYNDSILKECQQFGFVGAPTKKIREIPWQNGGFSFRKKSKMIEAIEDIRNNTYYFPEDRFFSVNKKHIVNPANWDVANRFSVETYFNEKPFGIHKCWEYQSNENMKKLHKTCPEINQLFLL